MGEGRLGPELETAATEEVGEGAPPIRGSRLDGEDRAWFNNFNLVNDRRFFCKFTK